MRLFFEKLGIMVLCLSVSYPITWAGWYGLGLRDWQMFVWCILGALVATSPYFAHHYCRKAA